MASNVPRCALADISLLIFLHDGVEPLHSDHPFYKLVEETRQGFLSSSDILEYMAESTFVDNNPAPQSLLLARVAEIQNLLKYNFPVVVGSEYAAIGGGLCQDVDSPDFNPKDFEKVDNREHVYLDQSMIDCWAKKSWIQHRSLQPIFTFLLKLILLREITITAWSIYGSHSHLSDKRASTPFADPTDIFVSGCGHLYLDYIASADRSSKATYESLKSIVFLNDEGGYIVIPAINTPIMHKLAAGDWSVFQRDVITSIGPYRWNIDTHRFIRPLWPEEACSCYKFRASLGMPDARRKEKGSANKPMEKFGSI